MKRLKELIEIRSKGSRRLSSHEAACSICSYVLSNKGILSHTRMCEEGQELWEEIDSASGELVRRLDELSELFEEIDRQQEDVNWATGNRS